MAPSNFETDQGLLHIWTKEINLQRDDAPESASNIDTVAEKAGREAVAEVEPVSAHRPQRKPMTGETAAASKALPKKKKASTQTRTSA